MIANMTTEVGSGVNAGIRATHIMAADCSDNCNVPTADKEFDRNIKKHACTPSIQWDLAKYCSMNGECAVKCVLALLEVVSNVAAFVLLPLFLLLCC